MGTWLEFRFSMFAWFLNKSLFSGTSGFPTRTATIIIMSSTWTRSERENRSNIKSASLQTLSHSFQRIRLVNINYYIPSTYLLYYLLPKTNNNTFILAPCCILISSFFHLYWHSFSRRLISKWPMEHAWTTDLIRNKLWDANPGTCW